METLKQAKKYAKKESLSNKNEYVYIIGNEYGGFHTSIGNTIPYIDEDLGFYLTETFFYNGEEYDVE